MADRPRAEAETRTGARENLLIELRQRELLLIGLGAPSLVARGELLRANQVELLDVPRCDSCVPRLDAASGNRNDAIRIHVVLAREPAQEGHPVERLVPDLGEPRSDDDRTRAVCDCAQRTANGDIARDHWP